MLFFFFNGSTLLSFFFLFSLIVKKRAVVRFLFLPRFASKRIEERASTKDLVSGHVIRSRAAASKVKVKIPSGRSHQRRILSRRGSTFVDPCSISNKPPRINHSKSLCCAVAGTDDVDLYEEEEEEEEGKEKTFHTYIHARRSLLDNQPDGELIEKSHGIDGIFLISRASFRVLSGGHIA